MQKAGGARGNQHAAIVPASDNAAKVTDLGLTRQQISEVRQVRDAEKASPGIVKRTLDAMVERGGSNLSRVKLPARQT